MDLRAMECDFSSTGRPACANEGLLVGCRRPSRKSLENFGSLPRTRCPTAGRACSDEVEEMMNPSGYFRIIERGNRVKVAADQYRTERRIFQHSRAMAQ